MKETAVKETPILLPKDQLWLWIVCQTKIVIFLKWYCYIITKLQMLMFFVHCLLPH